MDDEGEILRLFEDGDRALITTNVAELERVYAEDYVEYDDVGNASNWRNLILNLTSGVLRFVSMTSTGRRIRLFGDFATVHGSEKDVRIESEYNSRSDISTWTWLCDTEGGGRLWDHNW